MSLSPDELADMVQRTIGFPSSGPLDEAVAALRRLGRIQAALERVTPGHLRILADWHDVHDRSVGRTSTEVQDDLRFLADALEAGTGTVEERP